MSSSVLEQMRVLYETSEQLELTAGLALDVTPSGQKNKNSQQHYIAQLVGSISASNCELLQKYADADGLLAEELLTMSGAQAFDGFYDSVRKSREYHTRNWVEERPLRSEVAVSVEPAVAFSGDEVFGKYLDLHAAHQAYCNLPSLPSRDVDYLQYLEKFNAFFYLPAACRATKAYGTYVEELWDYLRGFFQRTQPLVDVDPLVAEWRTKFLEEWSAGSVNGWSSSTSSRRREEGSAPQPLRLGMFNELSELEALGAERLKDALEAMGLKCGGTLRERAERLWSVRGKRPDEYPAKLRVKATATNGGDDSRQQVAWKERCIEKMSEVLMDVVVASRRHAEKQHLRTVEEKEAEVLEEEFGLLPALEGADKDGEEDGDDEGPLYNPLNLPLGWDGKPIPFWLYKLHGLGIEYKCEICGNQSYWGRRAFDKHFQEWRHAQGMRCLGVPNTKHFHDITHIADALALFSKVRSSLKQESFNGDAEEEFEDTDGNVLNRRTYEDLARQGLL